MFFKAEKLYKKFDSFEIEASFEVEKNSMTGILGESGSGKSTLLRIICGLEKSDSAETRIFLDEKEITKVPVQKREIGLVFQNAALFSHMNVLKNVSYGLLCKNYKKNEAYKISSEFLKKFNLSGFEKRSVETLSGGEAQRVSLARTLIVKPKLVLFDESLSALDPPLRKKLGEEILLLQKEFSFTGIMVTHNVEEAKTLCRKIILLKKGKIVWQGKAEDFDESMM